MQHILDVVLLAMVFLWFPIGVFTFKFCHFLFNKYEESKSKEAM